MVNKDWKVSFLYPHFEENSTLFQFYKTCLDLFTDTILRSAPEEIVMLSLEHYNREIGVCRIIVLVAEDLGHLGKRARFENCIYSSRKAEEDKINVFNFVKSNPNYLQMDPRVNSEMFYILPVTSKSSFIINVELKTEIVSPECVEWFTNVKRNLEVFT